MVNLEVCGKLGIHNSVGTQTHVNSEQVVVVAEFLVYMKGPTLVFVADDPVDGVGLGAVVPIDAYSVKESSVDCQSRFSIPVKCS